MKAIEGWMRHNFLLLNAGKTEIMLFGDAPLRWSPSWWPMELGSAPAPKTVVKNLGVQLDQKLTLKEQVSTTIDACFHALGLLRRVFTFLPLSTRKTLIQTLVLSRLDYCNALLISASEASLNKLQVVQNTAARLVSNAPSLTPSLPLLQRLHWLPVRKQISFKICCIVHKSLNGKGPRYLAEKLMKYQPPRALHSGNKSLLVVPHCKN